MVHLPTKKNAWSRHQHLFEENARKTKKKKVCGFWKWWFESCLCMGKVLAPHVPVTRMIASNRMCKTWLQNYVFSLFMFIIFFPFLYFYFFGIDKSVALAPTYPRVRWGNQTYIVLWVWNFVCYTDFIFFFKVDFNFEQKSFNALDLKTML